MALDPVHIAIVDDEADLRRLVRLLIDVELAGVRHRITEAADGQAAIDLCRRERVDVMVLDLHMPALNGHEVLEDLCVGAERPCVVAWSADADALEVALMRGAHATATKGTDGQNVIAAVRGCLSLA